MKKRILSILLALCMLRCLVPVSALADDTALRSVAVQSIGSNEAEVELDLYEKMTAQVSVIKLISDIELSGSLRVDYAVTIDLNGHVLKMGDIGDGSVIKIESIGDLTIIDSRPDAEHRFNSDNILWTPDEQNGKEIVKGGIITGGSAGIEPLLILGVVARDALQCPAALQVDAAVADVAAVGVVSGQVHGRGGRAADLTAGRDHVAHGDVCAPEEIERVKRLVAAAPVQRLRAQKRRLLAVCLAAHAVEHAVGQAPALLLGGRLGHRDGGIALERAVAVVVVLIVVPAGADVCLCVTQHTHRASLP